MDIDFHRLSRERFERLCRQVVCEEYPGAQPVEARPGDEGIDAMRGVIDEHLDTIWQFKHFPQGIGKSQKGQIRGSLNRATAHKPDRWVCVLSCDPDANGHRYFGKLKQEFKAKHGIEVVCMSGTEMTNLLLKHQRIRDLYFPTTELEIRSLRRILAETHPGLARPKAAILKQVAEAVDYVNTDSPDVKFSFVAEEGMVSIFAEPRLGADIEMFRVTVKIPKGAAGERVRSQLNNWTKKGYPVTLEGDSFEVEQSALDALLAEDESFQRLEIVPRVPPIPLPLLLQTRSAEGQVTDSFFLDLKLVRRGSDESEFSNSSQGLPVDVSLTVRRTGQATLDIHYRPWGKRPHQVKRVNDFFTCVTNADEVQAIALDQNRMFGSLTIKPGDLVLESGWERLVDDLLFVEERMQTSFVLPEHAADADLQALKRLVRLLRDGYEDLNFKEAELTLEPEANSALDFEKLSKDRASMRFRGECDDETLALFGREFLLTKGRVEMMGELVKAERVGGSPGSAIRLTVRGIPGEARQFFDVSLCGG